MTKKQNVPYRDLNPGLHGRWMCYPLDHRTTYIHVTYNIHTIFDYQDPLEYFLRAMKYIKFQCALVDAKKNFLNIFSVCFDDSLNFCN